LRPNFFLQQPNFWAGLAEESWWRDLAAETVANKQLGSSLMVYTQFCMGYVLILSIEETAVVRKYSLVYKYP
jgi:hypothetical protein